MNSNPQIDLARRYVSETGVSIFLTGKAGTGKTTFLRDIVAHTPKRHVVVAPTGVAAINAGGVTIHSFFQLPFCPYLPDVPELHTEYQMKGLKLRKRKIDLIRSLDLLIIDEISMVRADLLDAIDYTLRRYRRSSRPFGGVQLLMIGDVQQLSPVVTDDEKVYMDRVYPSPFFFHSKALQRVSYVTIELKKIYRQQDQAFVELLNKVRDNCLDAATLQALNQRYVPDIDSPRQQGGGCVDPYNDYIRLTTHNRQADSVNQRRLQQLDSASHSYEAKIEGDFPESSFPTDRTLTLKVGAQVMFVKNQDEFYNGKIGKVSYIAPDGTLYVRDDDGVDIEVKSAQWENVTYEVDPDDHEIKQKVQGTFTQLPIRLAWAVTIHKAQGLTFDKVIVDAAAAFSYGQVYVALSRCRTLEGLVLSSPIGAQCAIPSSDVEDFVKSYAKDDDLDARLPQHIVQHFYDQLFELFEFSSIRRDVERLSRFFSERLKTKYPAKSVALAEAVNLMIDLVGVAEKFHLQLVGLSGRLSPDDNYLSDRVGKGAAYFLEQVSVVDAKVRPQLAIELPNKTLMADYKDLVSNYDEDVRIKQRTLQVVNDNGFSVECYQRAKVDSLFADSTGETKPTRKTKARSTKTKVSQPMSEVSKTKDPTWMETVRLFAAGEPVEDIATSRDLKPATITGHLLKALQMGAIDIDMLLSSDEMDELVSYFQVNPSQMLREAFENFGGRYPYYKLSAARYFASTID